MENEIDVENQALMDFALALKTGKEQLDICLEEARITKQAIRTAEECINIFNILIFMFKCFDLNFLN
jgi:hypothetical protein